MAARIRIRVDTRKLVRALEVMPDMIAARARVAMQRAGNDFDSGMRTGFRARSSASDDWLQARTGRLRDSFGFAVTGDRLGTLQLKVFSAGVPYANLQEFGGTITPKAPRKYLTVPLKDNLTAAGVPRYPSAADLRAQLSPEGRAKRGKDKLARARTAIIKTKKGKLIIILRRGSKTEYLWVLVEKVTVPPRLGFRRTWNKLAPARGKLLQTALRTAIKDAIGGSRG